MDEGEKESGILIKPLVLVAILLCVISGVFVLFTLNLLMFVSIGCLDLAVILLSIAGMRKKR